MFKRNFTPMKMGAGADDPIISVHVQTSLDDFRSEFEVQKVPLSMRKASMPEIESFNLKRMIDSGVDIKEVSSLVLNNETELSSSELDKVQKIINSDNKSTDNKSTDNKKVVESKN